MRAQEIVGCIFQQVVEKQRTQPLTTELWNWLPQELVGDDSISWFTEE